MRKIKTYKLAGLKPRDIANVQHAISELGFGPNDYKIVHYGSHHAELKVTSKELHWMLKSISKLERTKR